MLAGNSNLGASNPRGASQLRRKVQNEKQIDAAVDRCPHKTVDSLRKMAKKICGGKNLGDLNDIKKHANKEASAKSGS